MNLLAHAYLSFDQPYILVGNMISDYVKGKKKLLYPAAIQRGIALHRAIDTFTDQHPTTQIAKAFFRPAYRLYAGACVDVVYDHYLANDSNAFENETALNQFAQHTYLSLEQNQQYLPQKFAVMMPYLHSQNWLYHYRFKFGIEKSFGGLVKRSAYLTDSATAFTIFEANFYELQDCYRLFFPQLKQFALEWLLQNEEHLFTGGLKTM